MSFFEELKRRNVFRVGVAYAVVAWVILQVVDVVAPSMALPEWVPGFVILMLAIGAPVALLFAWAYEITPEGLRKTEQVDQTTSITHQTGRKIDRMIIGGLAVLVAFLLVDRFLLAPAAAGGRSGGGFSDASIAVLPFANLSGDSNEEYFSDGISEELLNVLAQIPELRVAARTSSFQFKNDNRDITEIARALNVAHVLEGSVRRSNDDVRITAQLIDASTGYHLWSDTYTRDGSDIFAVQDEISGEIVSALRAELGLDLEASAARNIETTSRDAYEAYLRGRHLVVQRTRATIEAAIGEFEDAIELDPEYAPAYAELSLAWNFLENNQYGDLTTTQVLARSEPHAEQALELDPTLAEAHAAMAFVHWGRQDLDQALTSLGRALEINPNYSAAYNWRGNILTDELARYAEGAEATAAALARDPLSIPALANTMIGLYDRGLDAEGEALYRKLAPIAPSLALLGPVAAAAHDGRYADVVDLHLEALEIEPASSRSRAGLARALASLGLVDEAMALDPPAGFFHAWLAGDVDGMRRLAAELIESRPNDARLRTFWLTARAGVGDRTARPGLEAVWEEIDGVVSTNGSLNSEAAMALVWLREGAGDDASDVRDALIAFVDRVNEAGVLLQSGRGGLGAAVEYRWGDRERGLAAVEAAGAGWTYPVGLPFLADLDADPEYRALLERRDRLVAAERAAMLARLCGADHPGADVWTPSDEVCSGG